MLGKIFKIVVVVIVVLAIWKMAGGTPDGVASLFETIFAKVGDFLNAIATKVADFFTHFLGGGAGTGGSSAAK